MNQLDDILSRYWGFSSFRPLQREIITSVLNGRDTIALLPTGGGKSLCYQIPALAAEGICIVISPLIALMQDQVQSLKNKGIKAINLSGGIPYQDFTNLLDNALYGNYKFLYLSPERLQQEIVQNYIRQMNVNLIAVDEAHCISQWGNDFRPAYKNIVKLRELQPLAPILAVTATATPEVLDDTIKELQLELPELFRQSFKRENIAYKVFRENDKIYRISQLLKKNTGSAIVYLRNRRVTVEVSEQLNALGITSGFYHGGLSVKEKKERLDHWKSGKISTIVATNAFGMGIDHANVRYVIHLQIPESIESYFQEAGRAGRDGAFSEAILLYNESDEKQVENQFISALPSTENLKYIYRKLNSYLQIPYGEGQYIRYQFNFSDFVKTYQLPSALTYNALRGFDRLGMLQLSEEFHRKTIVQFKIPSARLLEYFEGNMLRSVIGKALLRLYVGIFELPIAVDIELVASKTGQAVPVINKVLKEMENDNVIDLELLNTDATITFVVPREDDRTINRISREFQNSNRKKIDQVEAMIRYVKNDGLCRSVQLLSYFGEKDAESCGVCDVCIKRNERRASDKSEEILSQITVLLAEAPHSSKELSTKLDFPEKTILEVLHWLSNNEVVKLNFKNQFYLIQQ